MLKKQTVWFLTMLSLVIVLAVYYLSLPENNRDLSAVSEKGSSQEKSGGEGNPEDTSGLTGDENFEAIRLQLQDERSRKMEELQAIAASTDLSAEERSRAKDEMDQLSKNAEKEKLLESLITSTLGYEDALVRVDGNEVRITVKGQEPSRANANEIIHLVLKEVGTTQVNVAFQKEQTNDSK
ncbi:MAG: SpoIIIAH-like family protein [Caldibacillus debilis]|nr:SpoIIIAH-like family protein [Caldibacillus debilis]MBO2481587.1 SpoIIIAH-like family protein [Bacillaceae bacterium]MBY6273065.1 SpoIIIAH-like family protein [Bacillaceae bacterium]OUM88294.1 MAG: stage III sporulation protein AH [Caldibacillus debilis]REJ14374.1 MAG: SpoIIIAH-like family protein [Caldibacillus debilis]REJ27249.1 MAG: SpoIIIAH-like family protein [Caldibacillus debilis]